MQFDFKMMILIALIVFVPVLIAAVSVNRHVGGFIRKVESEEQEEQAQREKTNVQNERITRHNDDAGVSK